MLSYALAAILPKRAPRGTPCCTRTAACENMAPKAKQAARRAIAKAKARQSLSEQSAPGENDDHLTWLAAQEPALRRRISDMAIRAAAAKGTTLEIVLPLACKFAREEPSGFKGIMDVIEAPAGSDLDQLRWLTCQAEPLQQEVREAANEMATTLGVAMNDGFLVAVSRRARANPEAFMSGRARLNGSNNGNNTNDTVVPRAELTPFSGAAYSLGNEPRQQPVEGTGGAMPNESESGARKDQEPHQAEPAAAEACHLAAMD